MITLTGELDATTTRMLAALLDPLPQTPVRHVIVAAQELCFCDLRGLHQLALTHRALQAVNGHLAIAAAPPAPRRLIALMIGHGGPALTLYASVAAALSAAGTAPAPLPEHRP